ncbi:MAG: O-antigen ligase family protein [Actinomycetota bacterium]
MPSPTVALKDVSTEDPLQQLIFAAVYAIAVTLMWRIGFSRVVPRLRASWPALSISVLAMTSSLWSLAPQLTARRSIALLGTTLFGIYMGVRYSIPRFREMLFRVLAIIASLSAVTAIFMPAYGVAGALGVAPGWRGLFLDKNIFGRLMALGVVTALAGQIPKRKSIRILAVAFFGALLLLSDAKSGLVVLVGVGACAPLFILARGRGSSTASLLVWSVLIVLGVAVVAFENTQPVLNALGRDITLSGRTKLWVDVISMIRHRPLLGWGFGAFWRGWTGPSAIVWSNNLWLPPHSHSGLLDGFLDVGLVGMAIFCVSAVMLLTRCVLYARGATVGRILPGMLVIFTLLYNLTESVLIKQNSLFWVLYVFLIVSSSHAPKRLDDEP